jgi:N-acetylglutamate synthase-like GNAT family acetyltransferase
MTTPSIRTANENDIPAITQLLVACAQDMSERGMKHWLGVYDQSGVSNNLRQKQVYVLEHKAQIQGCIALGTQPADYYTDCWPDAPRAAFYITQLAVSPDAQGQGFGKRLMQHCIDKVGTASLQLDAVDHYPALCTFYQRLGFEIIATGVGLGDKRHLFLYRR